MNTAVGILSLTLVTLLPFGGVDGDPLHGGAIAWDTKTNDSKPSQTPPPPPEGRQEPTPSPSPPTYDPEPLICRVEAPFPNTDDCVMPVDPTEPPESTITPGDIERETKRVGLPRLRVIVQPPGATLVNLETIFHTTVQPFERTVTVLDSTVELRAAPVTYRWHHGDGTSQTTTRPGRPYPAMDVIHRYRTTGRAKPSVDVTYVVTYRIDDGDWQELDTPITASGPATDLRIREARPVLIH